MKYYTTAHKNIVTHRIVPEKTKVKYCSMTDYMQTVLFEQNFESEQKTAPIFSRGPIKIFFGQMVLGMDGNLKHVLSNALPLRHHSRSCY